MRFYKAAKPVMQFEYTRRNGVFRSAARVLRFGERRVDLCEIAACCAELIHDCLLYTSLAARKRRGKQHSNRRLHLFVPITEPVPEICTGR